MRVNIVHHHLNPGGVTRVIDSQIKALQAYYPDISIRLILGEVDDRKKWENIGIEVLTNTDLDYLYDSDNINKQYITELYNGIMQFFKNNLKKNDILHTHNLNLGKNPVFTYAIAKLAGEGHYVINHAHDFAEDRPVNYEFLERIISSYLGEEVKQIMYPDLPNYTFGVLNSSDYERLRNFNIDEKRITLLYNPVALKDEKDIPDYKSSRAEILQQLALSPDKKIITYPVRVIRRKNIGEYILLAVLFSDTAEWLVTQPPKNPNEIKEYHKWVSFCEENNINIHFEVGNKVNFEKLLVASDSCCTTSTQEGFGMAYLEPWLLNTPVIGRDIPYVTRDIKNAGVKFPLLYNKFTIEFEGQQRDFKDLPAEQQREFISLTLRNDEIKKSIISTNYFLQDIFNTISLDTINKNKEIIKTEFSHEKYANKLYAIYREIFE